MTCIKCKKEIPEGSAFCNWCGKKQGAKKQKTRRRARGSGSICKDSRNCDRPYIARAVPLRIGEHGAYIGAFASVREAQAAIEQYEQGKRPDLYNADLAKIYDLWSSNHFGTLSDSGVQGYKAAYKSIAELSRVKFRELKTADFQRCVDVQAEKGASRSKCEKIRQLCSQLCKWAMQNDIIDKNYAEFVKLPKKEKKEKQIFTAAEIEMLWAHKDDNRAKLVLFLLYTGFRIGEVSDLLPENIHLDKGYIIGGEKTKAGKDRIVPLPPSIPEITEFVRVWLEAPETAPFGVSRNSLRQYWFYPALSDLGIIDPPIYNPEIRKHEYKNPRLTPHAARHTFASLSAAAGMRPDDLQKIIGHADYSTTADIYVHQDLESLKAAMSKLRINHV